MPPSFFRALERETYAHEPFSANPVLVSSEVNLERVLINYSSLVMWIVPILRIVRDRAAEEGYDHLVKELTRNIAEELGSESEGVAHREIFADCLKEHFGIEVICKTSPRLSHYDPATESFINSLLALVREGSFADALGVIYALEVTATPELRVLGRLINQLAIEKGGTPPLTDEHLLGADTKGEFAHNTTTIQGFLVNHVSTWEAGHRDLLEVAINDSHALCSEAPREAIASGYRNVLGQMTLWWRAMATL